MLFMKSGRLNPNRNSDIDCDPINKRINPSFLGLHGADSQRQHQQELRPPGFQQQNHFNSPQIEDMMAQESKEAIIKSEENDQQNNMKEGPREKIVSATTKALNQMEFEADKKKYRRGERVPTAIRRKKFNRQLSRILVPKSALILLHDLKPGCIYNVQEEMGSSPPVFFAEVELDGEILGSGQGSSKSQAKNMAAEVAIKNIVSKSMTRWSEAKEVAQLHRSAEEEMDSPESDDEDDPQNLPWAGLASFAIYKMFSEWQNQGTDLPSRPAMKKKFKTNFNAPTKKDLPPNAAELHPAVVLNMVQPGLTAVELERDDTPKCRVKMAYVIEGKMFSGVGGNKKDAKREAAKAVLEGLYGLTYG